MLRKKNKYLLAPFLLMFVLLLLDKALLVPAVHKNMQLWNKIEPTFYQSREDLFRQLKSEYGTIRKSGKRLGLILGTSRSGEFDRKLIASILPGLHVYNFSAPLASPSYHYYWINKIRKAGMKIDFALLEVDPLLFGSASIRYSLSYSYDIPFMLKNIEFFRSNDKGRKNFSQLWERPSHGFSVDEAETFFLKRLFAMYRYPPNPKAWSANRRDITGTGIDGNQVRESMLKKIQLANQINLGGIPNPILHHRTQEEIEKSVLHEARVHMIQFKPAATQIRFFQKELEEFAEHGTPTIIYWPISPKTYRQIGEKIGIIRRLQDPIREHISLLEKRYAGTRILFRDLQYERRLKCRKFIDALHLSGRCYSELTNILLEDFR